MDSVKEIIFAIALLVGGGFAIDKIHDQVKMMALEKVSKGLPPMTRFTKKLTGINSKRIEKGYLE